MGSHFVAAGLMVAGLAVGCGPQVPSGEIWGQVTFAGKAAAGRTLHLVTPDGGEFQRAVSDLDGRFAFGQAAPGSYFIRYVADETVGTHEVRLWQSNVFRHAGAGSLVPTFDVAYNDVLFPSSSASVGIPVTLFWSTAPLGRLYRPAFYPEGSTEPVWQGPWSAEVAATVKQALPNGAYVWGVDIDGGDAGYGASRLRPLTVAIKRTTDGQ